MNRRAAACPADPSGPQKSTTGPSATAGIKDASSTPVASLADPCIRKTTNPCTAATKSPNRLMVWAIHRRKKGLRATPHVHSLTGV